jgi:dTMP kinase
VDLELSPVPFLIAIEGIDGAGKTTQAHFLQSALQEKKLVVVRTKEPTTGQYGQILRDSALTGRLSVEEEVAVFMKDRREHVDQVINPALRSRKVVIVDRYYFSTAAYQGCRGVDPLRLMAENETFAPEPDLLVILDVDPKVGLQRIRTRGDRANHFERTATLAKARSIFQAIVKPYKVLVDASKPAEEIKVLLLQEFSCRYLALQQSQGSQRADLHPAKR